MSKAFVYDIKNQINQEYQASPEWVISFVRWSNRDTLRFNSEPSRETGAPDKLTTRDILVIRNDCVSVSSNSMKGSHTPEAQLTLKAGDINYLTAIAPGDFFFVNILKYKDEADRVAKLAQAGKPINNEKDGFKGFFKVQSVRQTLAVDPQSGTKQLVFQVQGYAFTEFNSTVYFNPHLLEFGERQNDFMFVSRLGKVWSQIYGNKLNNNAQKIVKVLIAAIIGSGFDDTDKKILDTPNTHYYIPQRVGNLLGVPKAKAAKDLLRLLLGIQKYSGSDKQDLASGMNPSYFHPCQGTSLVKAEYWNQVALWSIINQYTNAPINEIYNCFKIDKQGRVLPTFVMRQTPFSTERYTDSQATKFLNLPRWRVSADLIKSLNIGRDEAARINFVQVFGRTQTDNPDANISTQIAKKNYMIDIADIQRSGLKPYVITSNMDFVSGNSVAEKDQTYAPTWARLLGDALIGGHMKLNGNVTMFGIVEPIAPGDNFELNNIVYHIEGVSHTASISANGNKDFSTTLTLSSGIDANYTATEVRYAANDNVDMLEERKLDYLNDKLLPGISDVEDINRLPTKENIVQPTNNGFNLNSSKMRPIKRKK